MMLKVVSIDHIEPYMLTCTLSDGSRRRLNIEPLFQNHMHLEGMADLLEKSRFLAAEIGTMGEVLWRKSIRSSSNEVWDYDISAEFIFEHGTKV